MVLRQRYINWGTKTRQDKLLSYRENVNAKKHYYSMQQQPLAGEENILYNARKKAHLRASSGVDIDRRPPRRQRVGRVRQRHVSRRRRIRGAPQYPILAAASFACPVCAERERASPGNIRAVLAVVHHVQELYLMCVARPKERALVTEVHRVVKTFKTLEPES